jgi:hypothetical protein
VPPLPRVALSVLLVLSILSAVTILPPASSAQEATPVSTNVAATQLAAASAWLRGQQDASGGFRGYADAPDPGTTTDAVMALYAARDADPAAADALAAAITYLDANGASYANTGAGQAAKLTLAAVTGGRDPHHFAGIDLLMAITAQPATPVAISIAGIYGDDLYDHAIAILALAAAGETLPDAAVVPLRERQGGDGGWAFDGATDPGAADSNTTALVIQALVASGHADDGMVARGLDFLRTVRAPNGTGFAYQGADPPVADANSTALVLQALLAAGEDPAAAEWGNAPRALASFQAPDGGLRYLAADEAPNLLATVQGIPALAGLPLPVAIACAADQPAESQACVPLAPAA